MRYYELTIKTNKTNEASKENKFPSGQAEILLEKVASYLPGPVSKKEKNPSFLSLEFYAQPQEIPELEKKLKADSLRYLILAKKPKKNSQVEKRPKVITKPKSKVEFKDIEKKLEEILNE